MASWMSPDDSTCIHVATKATEAIAVMRSGVLPGVTTVYGDGSCIAIPAGGVAHEDQPG